MPRFWLCARLETWKQKPIPLVSLYGGVPVNSFSVRGGQATVAEELRPMWDYMERWEKRGDRGAPDYQPPAVMLTDAPYTSEFLHSYTGVLTRSNQGMPGGTYQ